MEMREIFSFALALMFAAVSVAGVVYGGRNRLQLGKGIGTKFNRYIAMVVTIPIAAALALLGMLSEAMVTLILGALGYAFAGFGRDE